MAINYGKVIGRFLGMVEDGIDLDDDPDLVPLTGTVTFTPAVNKVLATQEDPPVQIFPQVVKATLDSQGYLIHNFKRGIKLLSPTGDINPSGWTWRVSFDLRQGSNKVAAESFDIELPAYVPGPNVNDPDQESTAVDLSRVSPVPSSTGSAIVRGDQGDPGKSAYQIAVDLGFIGTEAEWLETLKSDALGKSAYDLAVEQGFVGDLNDWLLSLRGQGAIKLREDYDKAILVGSSTMQGMASRFANEFATRGITTTHSKTAIGAWVASTMGMAVGTRPLVSNEFTIPTSGGVVIEPLNMNESNHGFVDIPGSFLGVSGVLTKPTGSNTWTFTRNEAGTARNVPAGTAFIPSEPEEYINGLAVLNIGKNTLTTTRTGWDAQRVIDMTESMIARFGGADGRVLVIGQFVNGGTPEVSTTRTKIDKYNDYFRERLGDRFFDFQAYVCGDQIWADTKLTPTQEDLDEQALGNIPPSVRNDPGHLNSIGYDATVKAIIKRIDLLGWIPKRPPIEWNVAATDTFNINYGKLLGTYTETGKLQYKLIPGSTSGCYVKDNNIGSMTGVTRIGIDPGTPDHMVEVTVSDLSSDPNNNGVRLLARAQGISTYYFVAPRASAAAHGYALWLAKSGGGLSNLGSRLDIVAKDGDRMGISAEGTTIKMWVNGEVIIEVENDELSTGSVGVELNGNAATTFDNMEIYVPTGFNPTPGDGIVTSDTFEGADITSFNRDSNAALGGVSMPWWRDAADRWGIKDNKLVRGSTTNGTGVCHFAHQAIRDGEIELKIEKLPDAGVSFFIDARRNENHTSYRVHLYPTGTFRLVVRREDSNSYPIGNPFSAVVGDRIGIRCEGDQISLMKNGVAIETVTDAEVATGPYWGMAYSMGPAPYPESFGEYSNFILREII